MSIKGMISTLTGLYMFMSFTHDLFRATFVARIVFLTSCIDEIFSARNKVAQP